MGRGADQLLYGKAPVPKPRPHADEPASGPVTLTLRSGDGSIDLTTDATSSMEFFSELDLQRIVTNSTRGDSWAEDLLYRLDDDGDPAAERLIAHCESAYDTFTCSFLLNEVTAYIRRERPRLASKLGLE